MTKTWEEWKAEHYFVRKGEKSCGRNEQGVAVFSEDQVEFNYHQAFIDNNASELGFEAENM